MGILCPRSRRPSTSKLAWSSGPGRWGPLSSPCPPVFLHHSPFSLKLHSQGWLKSPRRPPSLGRK